MIDTTKLNSFIPVWMNLTFIEGHSCVRKQPLLCLFLADFLIDFDKI